MLQPLSAVRNLKDPIKQFCCNFSLAFPASSQLNQWIDTKDLILRATSYGMPSFDSHETNVTWAGMERTYGGRQVRNGTWECRVVEVYDVRIIEIFKRWFNAYHNFKNGTIALLDQYTGTVSIHLLDPDVYEPVPAGIGKYDLQLFDVFPTKCDLPNIDASSADPLELTISLKYNYFLAGDEIDGQ